MAHQNAEKNEEKNVCFPAMDCQFLMEVCDCFKVVALAPVAGGVVVRNACAVHEIHITDMGEMKGLFLSLANKYRKGTIHKSDVVLKKEKDGSFSQVIVTGDYPAKFTY